MEEEKIGQGEEVQEYQDMTAQAQNLKGVKQKQAAYLLV